MERGKGSIRVEELLDSMKRPLRDFKWRIQSSRRDDSGTSSLQMPCTFPDSFFRQRSISAFNERTNPACSIKQL